jgi:uncharacterized protein (DUF2225 family)
MLNIAFFFFISAILPFNEMAAFLYQKVIDMSQKLSYYYDEKLIFGRLRDLKKLLTILLGLAVILGVSYGTTNAAEAKTTVISYHSCKDLNKVYKGGVARTSKVKNKGGKTYYKPYVSSALYDANRHLDRDHDLIACER